MSIRPVGLVKLKQLGIEGSILNWIESYLSDRSQSVVINGSRSEILPLQAGVPQGSVLGLSQVNYCVGFRVLLCFRVLVGLLSNVKSRVMLSSDNRNNMGYWIFNSRYCFKYVFLCF